MIVPFLIGLIIGGSFGFVACALFVVVRTDHEEEKRKYIK